MKSQLSIIQFREKLKEHTKIGMPQLKVSYGIFSIFFMNSKIFYGNFDASNFRFSLNYNFKFPLHNIIGNYQLINNQLKVNYEINSINKFSIIWLNYFPIIALIGFNYYFNFIEKNIPLEVYIISNLFFVFGLFYCRWFIKNDEKKLKKQFDKIFEIVE